MSYPQDKEANLKMAKTSQIAEPTTQHLYNHNNNNNNNNIHGILRKISSCVCINTKKVHTHDSSEKVTDVYYHKTLCRPIYNRQYKCIGEIAASKTTLKT